MTVRVNKQPFNIREKLSEVERPIGVKGNELMRAETAQEAGALLGVGRKNVIINGNQNIDQRNSGSATANFSGVGHFVTDRWEGYNQNGGTLSGQRVDDAPPGFKRSLKLTVGTASSPRPANSYGGVYYTVEGFDAYRFAWGTSGAKYAALSFWVKASVAGLYTVAVRDSVFNAYYIATYYIDSINTWEYKTVTIPPTTSGSFSAENGLSFSLFFALDTGSNAHGTAVNSWVVGGGNKYATSGMAPLFATSGNTWQITGVQLEVGRNATDFEHRSYGEELALCQRYFIPFPSRNGGTLQWVVSYLGGNVRAVCQAPNSMRALPTATDKGTGTTTVLSGNVYSTNGTNVNSQTTEGNGPTLSVSGSAECPVVQMVWTNASAPTTFSNDYASASWNGSLPGIFLDAEL